jgi:citrate lyase subunit beta/citryl-CoA lyase
LLVAEAIVAAPGVQRLVFGTLDYVLDLDLSGDPLGLDSAASRLALASRAAGIAPPVAGVTQALNDEAQLLADLARARAHGFAAKLCIHPRQVAAIHAALAPGVEEVTWARRVVAAARQGAGAVQLDGRMIDRPVIERARRTLERADR